MDDLLISVAAWLGRVPWDLVVVGLSAAALLVHGVLRADRGMPAHRRRFAQANLIFVPAELAEAVDGSIVGWRRASAVWGAVTLVGSLLAARILTGALPPSLLTFVIGLAMGALVLISLAAGRSGRDLPIGDVVSPFARAAAVVSASVAGLGLMIYGDALPVSSRSLLATALIFSVACHVDLVRAVRQSWDQPGSYLGDAIAARRPVALVAAAVAGPALLVQMAHLLAPGSDSVLDWAVLVLVPLLLCASPEVMWGKPPRFRTRRWPELPPGTIAWAHWTHADTRSAAGSGPLRAPTPTPPFDVPPTARGSR